MLMMLTLMLLPGQFEDEEGRAISAWPLIAKSAKATRIKLKVIR